MFRFMHFYLIQVFYFLIILQSKFTYQQVQNQIHKFFQSLSAHQIQIINKDKINNQVDKAMQTIKNNRIYCSQCLRMFDKNQHLPINICLQLHVLCQACLIQNEYNAYCQTCQMEPQKITQITVNFEILKGLYNDVNPMEIIVTQPYVKKSTDQLFNRYQNAESNEHLGRNKAPAINPTNYIENNNNLCYTTQQTNIQNNRTRSPGFFRFTCKEIPRQKLLQYLISITIQFVFTFCNLYFANNNTQTACMDINYGVGILTLRSWLWGIGSTEIVLIFLSVFTLFLHKLNIEKQNLQKIQIILLVTLVIKIILWASIQFAMFSRGLSDVCAGGIYAYLLIITILHVLIGLVVSVITGISVLR